MVMALRGDLDAAEASLHELGEFAAPGARADRRGSSGGPLVLARIALERGDPTRALAMLTDTGSAPTGPLIWLSPAAEAHARIGDLAATTAATAALRAIPSPLTAAAAAYAEGVLHLTLGDSAAAVAALTESAEGFAELQIPFDVGRARLELARALLSADPAAARVAADRAVAAFEQVGAKRHLQQARELLARLGVRPRAVRPARTGPLSAREVEVARLVAQGLTNTEIAEQLTLSVRTVTSHLDHIYARLGIRNRAELASRVAANPVEFT
jgi:DNA-binding NarL/FixJ family response regulator